VPTSSRPCQPRRGRAIVPAAAEGRAGVTGGGGRGPRNVARIAYVPPSKFPPECKRGWVRIASAGQYPAPGLRML
jgi:hypothetical protein